MKLGQATMTESTIVIRPKGGRIALADISTLIRNEGGELVATTPATWGAKRPAYRLRLSTSRLPHILAMLAARGHRLVEPITDSRAQLVLGEER